VTKLTGLTAANIRALREVFPLAVESGGLVLTATTATWTAFEPGEVVRAVELAMHGLPTRGHPRASLHAVLRKAKKA
jgi:hypothetical protein